MAAESGDRIPGSSGSCSSMSKVDLECCETMDSSPDLKTADLKTADLQQLPSFQSVQMWISNIDTSMINYFCPQIEASATNIGQISIERATEEPEEHDEPGDLDADTGAPIITVQPTQVGIPF